MKLMLLVGAGGFLGTVLRYAVSSLMKDICGNGFPWGTLVVNLVGCLVFGVILGLFSRSGSLYSAWCVMLTTGVCGGFTTFSAFANEGMQMLQSGNIVGFLGYVATSVGVGVCLTGLGFWMFK